MGVFKKFKKRLFLTCINLVKFIKPSLGLGIMFDLFTIENFGNLIVLLVLQAVLGFDNLLYISI